jgi:hypothetical protein
VDNLDQLILTLAKSWQQKKSKEMHLILNSAAIIPKTT